MTMRSTSRVVAKAADRKMVDPAKIPFLSELAPFHAVPLDVKPFKGFWCFNPSIHFDGKTWRCVVRCADYAMPEGVQVRSESAHPMHARTQNAMVVLDPKTWKPLDVRAVRELDGYPRRDNPSHIGFEDMRLFKAGDQLFGIAASLQLAGTDAPRTPEQVILTIDDRAVIVEVHPVRGIWNSTPQKNWTPFDGTDQPKFLYSIEQGIVFDATGPISGWPEPPPPPSMQPRGASHGGTEVTVRRKTIVIDAGKSGGRHDYSGLRGGTQLVRIPMVVNPEVSASSSIWLGLGHSMQYIGGKKFYWHVFYTVDDDGQLIATSQPFKLAPEGIEFAAGIAIDGDRVIISYGVDDMLCRIGETSLAAIMGTSDKPGVLRPVDEIVDEITAPARPSNLPRTPLEQAVHESRAQRVAATPPAVPAQPARGVSPPVPAAGSPAPLKPLTDVELRDINDPILLRRAYQALRDRAGR